MDKPVISIWGFGPSYRNRVKYNITEALNSGYENIMDYVILTDYPEDFDELRSKTDKIKAVVNIHEIREQYEWSKELEYIPPSALDAKKYGDEYKNALSKFKYFSYSVHRFSFPTIASLGYNKVVFMDGDVKIHYDRIGNRISEEDFWNEFITPVNSMKGCVHERISLEHNPYDSSSRSFVLNWSAAMGTSSSLTSLPVCAVGLYHLYEKHGINRSPIIDSLHITEGPFRYYHFESPAKLLEYFNIWNDSIQFYYGNSNLKLYNQCGGYMLCDYIPVAVTNIYHNIQVLNFPNNVYERQIHYTDRYFLPLSGGAPGLGTHFTPGNSEEDFIEKNKELKQILEERNAWPHIEPY
jgi:hypothetical protein